MFMVWGKLHWILQIFDPRDRVWEGGSPWRLCTGDPRYRTWERCHPGDCRNVTPGAGSGVVTLETAKV